jgi:hypothetical protein
MSFTGTAPNTKPSQPKQEVQPKKYVLNTSHRCDSCGVQAYVQVTLKDSGLDLLFCKHHHNKHELALLPVTDHEKLIDESDRLRDVNRLVGSENS